MPNTSVSMKNRICMVTGATSGIGFETALALAQQGATTILAGRNRKKSQKTVERIQTVTNNSSVDYLLADLSSPKDTRQLAEQFRSKYQCLDVLVNNAGAKIVSRQETADGLEMTLALNHLAHFLLTNLLLDLLKNAGARIINISSGSHGGCSGIDFDDLQSQKNYVGKVAYAQSKLANVLFTYELSRRLQGTGITVNALAPPGAMTGFCRNNGWIRWLKHVTAHVLARDLAGPVEAAKTSIYLATSPDVEGVTGKYFVDMKPVQSSNASYDEEAAKRLWEVSLELTGLS